MKKFEDWLYWEGTKYITMFYFIIVPLLVICDFVILAFLFALLLFPWSKWMKKYQKEYNNNIDKDTK